MKAFKKPLSVLLCAIMLVSMVSAFGIGSFAVNMTNKQAVDWAIGEIGKSHVYDKGYSASCVQFVKCYYEFLGVTPVRGNGCDYATNSLPSGWIRLPYSSDLIIQPGDIAVWTYMSSAYGHVAIVESVEGNYMNVIDQSVNFSPATKRNRWPIVKEGWTFYGVIRPNFIDKDKPVISDVKVTKIESTGYTISFKATDNSFVKKVSCPTWTSKNGQDDLFWNEKVTNSKSDYICSVNIANHKFETGDYKTDIYVYDSNGNVTAYNVPVVTVPEDEDGYRGYPDVFVDSWFYDGVRGVSIDGFMSGYSGGKFGPNDALQRQDFVSILARISGEDLNLYANKPSKMKDAKKGTYYYAALNWAVENGVVAGYENGNFGVGDKITREQVCTILYRFMGSPEVKNAQQAVGGFSDASKISSYAVTPTAWAVQNNVISGMSDGRVAPTDAAARAQIATIINNMHNGGMF
ncbi:MAG: S-layer homology domain-containing protein [Clostridia bacterium]|nr:S-layer homology domain-containing protein [Clostridia bacterium]